MVYGRRLPRIYAPGVLHKHDSRDVFSDFVLLFYILLLFNPGQLTTIPCEYAELDGTSGNSAVFVTFFSTDAFLQQMLCCCNACEY